MFTAALFTIARTWKQSKCPSTEEWIKKMWYIYNGISLSHKKERNWVICRDVDGRRDCHTEWSKSEREKQISYINAYMWNLKKLVQIVLFTKQSTSLVAQWLRIRLPMQGTWVQLLVREDPTCRRATKPVGHNYWACALEPVSHNYWARAPRARAPQQEKPPQWQAHVLQGRVAPARSNEDPTETKINKINKF